VRLHGDACLSFDLTAIEVKYSFSFLSYWLVSLPQVLAAYKSFPENFHPRSPLGGNIWKREL